jgi:hypothetical protein
VDEFATWRKMPKSLLPRGKRWRAAREGLHQRRERGQWRRWGAAMEGAASLIQVSSRLERTEVVCLLFSLLLA